MKKAYSEKVISAFLENEKIIDIMNATGLSRATIDRYRKDDELQRILTERKAQYIAAAVAKMQAGLSVAADVLYGIINDPEASPQTRVNAISVLFTACKNWTETTDILRRIEALETAGGDEF